MQFHAAARISGGPSPTIKANATRSSRSLEAESVLLPLQPGRLHTIKQHAHRLQQHGSPVPLTKKATQNNQRTSDGNVSSISPTKPPRYVDVKPEPINYLKLRRTDESTRALQRNRTQHVVTHEILQPSASSTSLSPTKKPSGESKESLEERLEALQRMDHVLAEMQDQVLHASEAKVANTTPEAAPASFLAGRLQQLHREQALAQKQSEMAAHRVQDLLTVVRNDISLMYKFTPLFKIYARHKTKSAWHYWTQYVEWHREEQARLALLWPYAVTIQRVFRTKRSRWQRGRMRMAIAWQRWQASMFVQRAVRGWLGRRERCRLAETREAIKLQAAWRGRRDRRWVKLALRDQLRVMLRSLTPTGNLHRLHEVMQRNPELARPLNAMLSLIEETHVVVDTDTTYKAKNARIAAKITAKPIEATRRQLFHAVFELSEIVRTRNRVVQEGKAAYTAKLEEKQRREKAHEDMIKAQKLLLIREKLSSKNESEKMHREELLMREYMRMLKTADTDRLLHITLDQARREQSENARMVIEEYQIRYYVAEVRRRRQEDETRLQEVERRQQFLREQAQRQTEQLMEILKTDEMKRNEIRTKRLQAKAEENELWSKMSKQQQADALHRLELKEQLEEEERRRAEAILLAEQAHHREVTQKREKSRLQKQAELARELATREAMEREEKLCRRAYFDMKRALHAETWKAKREKEQVRYSLDPMHFNKIQAVKQQEERERRERYLMRLEDEMMGRIHERERKERYFEQCRQRRKMEKLEALRADKEKSLMHAEDIAAEAVRAIECKAEEHRRLRAQMATLAKQDDERRSQRAREARNRKEMHEEEMRQRRVAVSVQLFNELREKREREAMAEDEVHVLSVSIEVKSKADKRFREQCIFRMMREDVASMERQDWEEEGHRLEQLLWAPDDIVAFSCLVTEYPHFLTANVSIVRELCSLRGPPPYDFYYEAVQNHRRDEATLPLEKVPRKKRKPRKFFYHEFFEDDPILSKLRPSPATPSKARQRWKRVAEHFFGDAWSHDSVRTAYLLMSEHKYADAASALLEAVRMADASASRQSSMSLLRQVARCYLKCWEASFQRSCLDKSLFYFQRATSSLGALANPRFLQEIATGLEKSGRYREAAEVISGVIQCFPRYPKLNEVIFRGGIVMISLGMHQQSREYLLHTLDSRPFDWEQHEILFLVARVMQLEGKLRRKLCSVAYEEAFRKNKRDAYYRLYPTWKEWIKSAETWRDIGDNYYAKHEFYLARDAFQVMLKRIYKVKGHNENHKRQRALDAHKALQCSGADETSQALDDNDWLRVARCAAILNDCQAATSALNRWFARMSYRDRVLEQFYKWPLARWKLLGVDVPERVVEVLERKKKQAQEAEEAKLKAIEDRRLSVLRQRSVKAKGRLIAWASNTSNEPATRTLSVQPHNADDLDLASDLNQIAPWQRIVDNDKHEVYYWNKETGDVAWDPPTA